MEADKILNPNNMTSMSHTGPQRTKKKRVRHWTAEDRAVHREFEKSRREAFSERLMNIIHGEVTHCFKELATLLPMLNEETRPSKHIIVDASIAHHKTQQTTCDQAASTIRELLSERDELLEEVDSLCALYRPGTSLPRQAQPVDLGVLEFLAESNNTNRNTLTMLSGKTLNIGNEPKEPLNTSQPASFLPTTTGTDGVSQGAVCTGQPIEPPPFAYSPVGADWILDNSSKAPTAILHDLIDASFLWNQSSETISSQSKAGEPTVRRDSSASCLVSDSASFWNMHPGAMLAAPENTNLQYDIESLPDDVSLMWPQNTGISGTISTQNEQSMSPS
ncbi:hypothetical protein N7528_008881 [Penicillium herquei]|nr:hypothetical protein N7528_008881 [Penicillium herquei]